MSEAVITAWQLLFHRPSVFVRCGHVPPMHPKLALIALHTRAVVLVQLQTNLLIIDPEWEN